MKLRIDSIDGISERGKIVTGTTDYGTFRGIWKNDIPKVGTFTDVEIDINTVFDGVRDLQPSDDNEYKISFHDSIVTFVGKVESIEDNVIFFRIGKNLIQIEVLGELCELDIYINCSTHYDNISFNEVHY